MGTTIVSGAEGLPANGANDFFINLWCGNGDAVTGGVAGMIGWEGETNASGWLTAGDAGATGG